MTANEGWKTALSLLWAAPRNMYWLKMSVEKVKDGLAASSGGFCSSAAGGAGSSARAAMKGKEIVKNKTIHNSVFFLIAHEFISFAPFLMLSLEPPFLIRSFLPRRPDRKSVSVPHFQPGRNALADEYEFPFEGKDFNEQNSRQIQA